MNHQQVLLGTVNGGLMFGFDLNNRLTSEFRRLWAEYLNSSKVDESRFRRVALNELDEAVDQWKFHDAFFTNLGRISHSLLQIGKLAESKRVLDLANDIAKEWDETHEHNRLHKGALYYLYALRCIVLGDLEQGFLLMHCAHKEDKLTSKKEMPDSPALAFVTLDREYNNQSYPEVLDRLYSFVENRLASYRVERNGRLSLPEFRERFLLNQSLIDSAFYFAFTSCKLHRLLVEFDRRHLQSNFASLMVCQAFFTIGLVLEKAIAAKNANNQHGLLKKQLSYLGSQTQLNLTRDTLDRINNAFNEPSTDALGQLLSDSRLQSGKSATMIEFTALEADFAIVYGLRNKGAHSMKATAILIEHLDDIVQRLYNSVFFAVEHLL